MRERRPPAIRSINLIVFKYEISWHHFPFLFIYFFSVKNLHHKHYLCIKVILHDKSKYHPIHVRVSHDATQNCILSVILEEPGYEKKTKTKIMNLPRNEMNT